MADIPLEGDIEVQVKGFDEDEGTIRGAFVNEKNRLQVDAEISGVSDNVYPNVDIVTTSLVLTGSYQDVVDINVAKKGFVQNYALEFNNSGWTIQLVVDGVSFYEFDGTQVTAFDALSTGSGHQFPIKQSVAGKNLTVHLVAHFATRLQIQAKGTATLLRSWTNYYLEK